MELNINNIDVSKLDLGLRHEYEPQTEYNLSLDEKERIVMDCEYFAVGEKMKFSKMDENQEMSIDYTKIFRKKVKGIHNLIINKKPVTTADEFLRYPGIPVLDALMTDVVIHIMKADDLTEDEVKN